MQQQNASTRDLNDQALETVTGAGRIGALRQLIRPSGNLAPADTAVPTVLKSVLDD